MYSKTAKFFHWTIAAFIIFNLLCGPIIAYFHEFAHKISLMPLHKQLGVIVLTLAILRVLWRITHKYPNLKGIVSPLDEFFAQVGHILLYILMVLMPLSGVLLSQGAGREVSLLWFKIPAIIGTQTPEGKEYLFLSHKYISITLAVILGAHILAALYHHFIKKNNILLRMMPDRCTKKDQI